MKKSDLRKLIKKIIQEQAPGSGIGFQACCDPSALNYNTGCTPANNCTCNNASCVTSNQICSSVVNSTFANNLENLGCAGLQQRRNRIDNKLGVVSTPGATLPGPGNWDNYNFSADSIGVGAQGTGHSNWQTLLQNKLICFDLYMQSNNC